MSGGARSERALAGGLLGRPLTHGDITRSGLAPIERGHRAWRALVAITGAGTALFLALVVYTFTVGIGLWGNDIPVAWAFAIINFVWWIGIGHAGTFISAFLVLLQQQWRASTNRLAEAMTLFAVVQAGLMPVLHLGRPWFAYWLVPYPSTMGTWPQFRGSLTWDIAAITTYATVSLLFWYVGMVPDLATARDHVTGRIRRKIYGFFALGWTGSGRDWSRLETTYGLLAGLATPLVISVHSIVSLDFAITLLPGWHSTIFPPYFVIGALLSGFAMVLTLLIPARALFPGMKDFVTARTVENMCKIITVTGTMVGFAYITEFFIAWYGANPFEQQTFIRRMFGPYWWAYWAMFTCNVVSPQVFWFKWCRTNIPFIFLITIVVNIGMWFERFVIVSTLSSDFMPSAWGYYSPTFVDIGTFIGSLGIFMTLFLLFCRFLPMLAISEVKNVMHQAHEHLHPHDDHHGEGH